MATDQVLNWIGGATVIDGQQPLKLSQPIESFESDFCNGYLFGEILSQYGICESANTFSKKTNKEAKVHNFYQIEDALRFLKVPFDAKLSHQIMNEERGASLRLLYQLKLSLDKHFAKGDMSVTNLKQKTIDTKVKKVKELSTKLPEIHAQHGVEGPTFKFQHKPLIMTEKKLLKYEVARANLEKKAADDDLAETNMLKSIQQSKRQDALAKMKENQTFMKEWLDEGKQNWKQNREIRAKEMARMLSFDDREVQIYKEILNKQLVSHTNEMNVGIEEFHENMQKLGIEQNISIQEATKRQAEKAGIPPGQIQNFSYAATMNKIKETKNNNEFAGKERERRNRKMQVDQRRIQETLDAKKHEENLLVRLMNQQAKEKDVAYSRWRDQKCEAIVQNNMVDVCSEKQKLRDIKTKQIEQEMKKTAEEAELGRKSLKAQNQIEFKQIRMTQKLAKRNLNIEIASEILDLVMDVADEAFDFQEENSSKDGDEKLLTKATWRDWMEIFTKGKKVSEQNIVINEEEETGQQKGKDSMAMLLGGSSSAAVQPFKLLNEVKNEPVFDDLLQYICMSGPLNLRLVAPDKWNQLKNITVKDLNLAKRNLDLGFLDELQIPQNIELGQYIDKLYNPKQDEMNLMNPVSQRNTDRSSAMKKAQEAEQQPFKADFPTYHPIKLCLIGKAYSGKKTQAQMIIDKIGADKITLFNMNDIVREAINYVDKASAKVEEVVDPKAKGKGKPAAGDATADIFAGKDSTQYKEIATLILNQIQLITGDKESVPAKDVDLLSLVSDDSLLAQLFVQKLKLTFKNEGPTKEEQEAELRDLVEKEKVLLAELEEAKNNGGAEVDPKAKGKPKATKSPEEIQEEMKQMIAADRSGWMLMDFPRNINQAKQLEALFQGYELLTDGMKSQKLLNFEAWTKFSDPFSMTSEGYIGEIVAQPSMFDKVIVLQTSKEECFRRSTKRKQDPTTNSVYHEEDQPAPDDPKVTEKLVPYFGVYSSEEEMIQKLDSNHIQATENEPSLTSFMRIFGNLDQVSGKGITALDELRVDEKKDKDAIFEKIESSLNELFDFKQIARDREFENLKQQIMQEEQAKLEAEAAAEKAAAEEAAGSKAELNQEEKKEEEQEAQDNVPKIELEDAMKTVGSKASLHSKMSHQVPLSHSKMSQSGMASKKQKRVEYTREYKISLWEEMETLYIRDGMMTLSDIKRQKESVTDSLNLCQRQFIQFLERPCEKQEKINEFVLSFNKFSMEFPDLRKDDQTKEELMNRLEQLSDTMWNVIETRKNESIEQITKMSTGGWSDQEMRNLCRNMASLVEIEIKKFEAVYKIQMMQDPPIELDAEIFMKKLIDRGGKTYDGETKSSPVLEQVITNLLTKLDDLVQKNPIVRQVIHDMQGKILVKEMNIFIYRLSLINSWALVILEEIFYNSRQVYGQLDDWIVDAVAQENSISQQILGVLKEAIQSEQIKIEEYQTILQNLSLMSRIQTQHFSGNEVPLYLQNVHIPSDDVESSRFTVTQLRQLYSEMRFFTGSKGSLNTLDSQTYVNLMVVAFRQGRVPLTWKYVNFDKISGLISKFAVMPLVGQNSGENDSPMMYKPKQGLGLSSNGFTGINSRTWIDWQTVITFFALMNSCIPNEKDLAQLRVKLSEAGTNQQVTKIEFKTTQFWFDSFEGRPDAALEARWIAEKKLKSEASEDEYESEEDEEGEMGSSQQSKRQLDADRVSGIKDLLFDIHRVNTGEDKLNIPTFIDFMIQASSIYQNCDTFADAIFGAQ